MNDMFRRIDAYWRASNYLSVGQIYLLANPLLREPLRLEHVKPRLLGHWGTTPGLNFIYVHANRLIVERGLDAIFVAGPGHGGPGVVAQHVARGDLQRGLSERLAGRARHAGPLQAVLVPGRHPEPRRAGNAGQHPRGRGAGLRAQPRVRRGVRQPEAARLLRRRRRRGRDGPDGDELALQQVPRIPRTTAPCCPSCTSTATRSPGPTVLARIPARGARAADARLRLGAAASSRDDDPAEMHARWPPPSTRRRPRSHASRARRAPGASAPGSVADDRPSHAQGLDGTQDRRRACRSRAPSRAHQVPFDVGRDPARLAMLESWMKSYRPEELFDDGGRRFASCAELATERRAPHERQPARQRRPAPQGPAHPRLHAVRRRRARRPGRRSAEATRVQGSSSATSWCRTPSSGTSASSAPTRRRPTAGARSSR